MFGNLFTIVKLFEERGEDIKDWFLIEETFEYDDPHYTYEDTVFVKGNVVGRDDLNDVYEQLAVIANGRIFMYKGVPDTESCYDDGSVDPDHTAHYERMES